MWPIALTPDGIVEMVRDALRSGGGCSMGVEGALAEFAAAPGDLLTVGPGSGRMMEARTSGGGLRLTITDETVAFAVTDQDRPEAVTAVYLTVPRRSLPVPAAGMRAVDGDPAALRHEDREELLIDLAVGHASVAFCVRTGDPGLGKRLRLMEGATWQEVLEQLGHELVAASPHRVVMTPLGRIEVYSPIPAEAGSSPDGPHTHLLPALLRTGRELPAGLELPEDLAPVGAFHPPAGWKAPMP